MYFYPDNIKFCNKITANNPQKEFEMRKEYDIIGDAAYGCLCALIVGGIFFGAVWFFVEDVINYNKAKKVKK